MSASDNRVALITGCSDPSSLGAALALCLVKKGWKVYTSALEVESMASIKAEGCEVRTGLSVWFTTLRRMTGAQA